MISRSVLKLGLLFAVALSFLSGGFVSADSVEKAPDARKALKKAAGDLMKHAAKKGFTTRLAVDGGMSNKADHKIVDQAVTERYTGKTRGPVMFLPERQIFRTPTKGAEFNGDFWRVLQSTAEGKKLDRLFAFPERVLQEAGKTAKSVEWLESKVPAKVVKKEKASGRTAVGGSTHEEKVYHRMRATLPSEVALKYFIDMQNSGCLSGG